MLLSTDGAGWGVCGGRGWVGQGPDIGKVVDLQNEC